MGSQRRGVEARGSSVRIEFVYRGQRCRETLKIPPTAKNLEYAERKRAQVLYEIEIGSFDYSKHFPESTRAGLGQARSECTVSKALDLWLKTRSITATTRARYNRIVAKHITPELGARPIAKVLRSDLELWRANIAKDRRPKTVNNALILIRGAFELAHADGIIKSNPAAQLRNMVNPRRSDADPFAPAEIAALLEAFDGQHRNLVEFWASTGMREGELFGLEWRDIDWQGRRALVERATVEHETVDTKTKADRFVHLGDRALAALQAQRQHTALAGHKVFINPDTGQPWGHPIVFYRKFQRACVRAKVRWRAPKQLRHTYASIALSAGEPPLFVMHQLGHASLTMLERHYARWLPSANLSAGTGFDRAVGRSWGAAGNGE